MSYGQVFDHPRLLNKCRELAKGDECAARALTNLVIHTAADAGKGGAIFEDGRAIWLPRHVRRMKLHLLMEQNLSTQVH